MSKLIYVALGGAAGAVARYLVGVGALRSLGPHWPYGTFAVNLIGGFLMGLLAGYLAHRGGADQERWRLLLGVGLLGGFTTFSTFSLETVRLMQHQAGLAALYVAASMALSIGACWAGLSLGRI